MYKYAMNFIKKLFLFIRNKLIIKIVRNVFNNLILYIDIDTANIITYLFDSCDKFPQQD